MCISSTILNLVIKFRTWAHPLTSHLIQYQLYQVDRVAAVGVALLATLSLIWHQCLNIMVAVASDSSNSSVSACEHDLHLSPFHFSELWGQTQTVAMQCKKSYSFHYVTNCSAIQLHFVWTIHSRPNRVDGPLFSILENAYLNASQHQFETLTVQTFLTLAHLIDINIWFHTMMLLAHSKVLLQFSKRGWFHFSRFDTVNDELHIPLKRNRADAASNLYSDCICH